MSNYNFFYEDDNVLNPEKNDYSENLTDLELLTDFIDTEDRKEK